MAFKSLHQNDISEKQIVLIIIFLYYHKIFIREFFPSNLAPLATWRRLQGAPNLKEKK